VAFLCARFPFAYNLNCNLPSLTHHRSAFILALLCMQLTQPVLLLWGKNDEILPVALADKWLAALSARPQGSGSVTRVDIDRAG